MRTRRQLALSLVPKLLFVVWLAIDVLDSWQAHKYGSLIANAGILAIFILLSALDISRWTGPSRRASRAHQE